MTYDGDNLVAMWIPTSLFHDFWMGRHRTGPHHPQLKPFHPKGIFKLGAQLLLNLPGHHSLIPYLLGEGLPSFISTSQWEPPPTSYMECPILRVQESPHSLQIEDFHLHQLISRELQPCNSTAVPPFHPLVVGAYQQNLQWTANG